MRWLLTSALLATLAACQCVARVTVSGSLEQGIDFHALGGEGNFIGQGELQDLTVRMVGSNDSNPVWHIKGKARIASLRYGVVPSGMIEDAPAKPLEPGHTYVIGIAGSVSSSTFTPSCKGGVSFAIGPDGKVTSCYEEESQCG